MKKRLRVEYSEEELEPSMKAAAAKASPSVVGILSRHLPADMAVFKIRSRVKRLTKAEAEARGEIVFWGSGVVIECEHDLVTRKFSSTILTAATLFVRTNAVLPHQIQVDVYLSDGNLCDGHVIACDFHYNLAAVRIQTDSALQTATLRSLDDVVPIHPTEQPQSQSVPEKSFQLPILPIEQPQSQSVPEKSILVPEKSFQLLPHSKLYKMLPRTKIITLGRTFKPLNAPRVGSGAFRTNSFDAELDCLELYWVKNSNYLEKTGGTIINFAGEVIGIMFYDSAFLPINVASRWWKHFKSCGQYRRPWLGIEVANLPSSRIDFLGEFMRKFPKISTGVIVTKVAEGSPAYFSGIRPKDVIVICDGKSVHSKLEFFDIVWEKVGETLELSVLRASDGEQLKLSLTVEEATPEKFYKWELTPWMVHKVAGQVAL